MILEKLKFISKIITSRTAKSDWDTLYVNVKDNPLVPIMNMNLKISNLTVDERHQLAEHINFLCTEYPSASQFRTPQKFIKYLEGQGYQVIKTRQNIKNINHD